MSCCCIYTWLLYRQAPGMKISTLFVALSIALGLFVLPSAFAFNKSGNVLKPRAGLLETRMGARVSGGASAVKCKLQGAARPPAFWMDGDYIIGGVFSIHYYMHTVKHNYTSMPELLRCTGRLVRWRSGAWENIRLCQDRNIFDSVLTILLKH